METIFEIIEKENIHTLKFPSNEVLNSEEEIRQRFIDLNRALYLGNLEHSKIKIFFEDNQSKKVVEKSSGCTAFDCYSPLNTKYFLVRSP